MFRINFVTHKKMFRINFVTYKKCDVQILLRINFVKYKFYNYKL